MPIQLDSLDLDAGPELAEDTFALDLGMGDVEGILDFDFESEAAEPHADDLCD